MMDSLGWNIVGIGVLDKIMFLLLETIYDLRCALLHIRGYRKQRINRHEVLTNKERIGSWSALVLSSVAK